MSIRDGGLKYRSPFHYTHCVMKEQKAGVLHIVATPIGNLEDISLRALRVLKECDAVFAEDTRRTLKLLSKYEIRKPVYRYTFIHTKDGERLKTFLREGKSCAFVSDAGMPGIQDPGQELVCWAREETIPVVAIPGATAFLLGLLLSGFKMHPFTFYGFIPRKKNARKNLFEHLHCREETLVFYETPHRLKDSLEDMNEIFRKRRICVARELTKKFEEVLHGTAAELAKHFEKKTPMGEFTLVVENLLKT